MTTTQHYCQLLSTLCDGPQYLLPEDAQRALEIGRNNLDEIALRNFAYWLLQSTTPETNHAVRVAWLTMDERRTA